MRLFSTIAVLAALGLSGVGAGVGVHALVRSGEAAQRSGVTPATIGALRLSVPDAFLRSVKTPADRGSRLDLVFAHPSYGPAPQRLTEQAQIARALVFVAVLQSDGELDPAERPQDLYGRFLEADAWQNPGGLLLRRFQPGSPYEDEELYLAPPDGRAFAARCRKPDKATEGIGESCLWRVRRDGADLQVRFSPELLPDWETIARGLGRRIGEWTAVSR